MTTPRFCKDCKWCVPQIKETDIGSWPWTRKTVRRADYEFAKCSQPSIIDERTICKIDAVTGIEKEPPLIYCSVERSYDWDEYYQCGASGKLWEPKP